MELLLATKLANELRELLFPVCERFEIAGGIRRKKPEPHDIEIVCVPRVEKSVVNNGLSDVIVENDLLNARISGAIENKVLAPGDPDKSGKKSPLGPKYYRLKYKEEKVDIFTVRPPAQWGVIFLIRTGDAEFSHWFVQQGWNKGLRIVDGHLEKNKKVIDTLEEADVFKAMGLDFVSPENRIGRRLLEGKSSTKDQN